MKIPGTLLLLICLNITLSAQAGMKKNLKGLVEHFDTSTVFNDIFTGFALYDPETGQYLMERDADKYFTPASNTKVFTLYASMMILGDSITALRYVEKEDSLFFWGTGNPLFLHPEIPSDSSVFTFLKNTPHHLFYSSHTFDDDHFGPGWAWDDYAFSYQVEKSPMPIYGNMATFRRDYTGEGFEVNPPYFEDKIAYKEELSKETIRIRRAEHANLFYYNGRAMTGLPFERFRPFKTAPHVFTELLTDTLGRVVKLASEIPEGIVRTLRIPLPDTLYQRLMKDSDNFVAEQLLLLCSEKLSGYLETDVAISYALDSLFTDFPDPLIWTDGSGLSRYNLFTPRTMVGVLDSLYHKCSMQRLTNIFPAGGVSGTIDKLYAGNDKPYVYAKTGTLSNKHCLSGYIRTNRGKWYIFSFMNNNYINGTQEVKVAMEGVLEYVRDRL
jgi:D-alanyl-D-alanine carboxypeptidase/D-alanyl-D-alanine-endopeptidase (penicillin-binding protein 4)